MRIERWGDEVDSIRSFDVESQRSVENLSGITIYPASENWRDGLETVSFLEYFPKEKSLLFLDEPQRLQEMAEEVEQEYFHSRESRIEAGMDEAEEDRLKVFRTKDIIGRMNQYSGIASTILESRCGMFQTRKSYSLQAKGVNPYNSSFELLTRDLKRLKREGYRTVLLFDSMTRAKRLAEDLRAYDMSRFHTDDMERTVNPGEIWASFGQGARG